MDTSQQWLSALISGFDQLVTVLKDPDATPATEEQRTAFFRLFGRLQEFDAEYQNAHTSPERKEQLRPYFGGPEWQTILGGAREASAKLAGGK